MSVIAVFFIFFSSQVSYIVLKIIAIALILFLINFFVVKYFLEKFVYRKIKLIYKTIHDYKLSKEKMPTSINSNEAIFEGVEEDIKSWAENTSKEISNLKSLENYRKDFVGNITHELKTPIFTIQGFVHTLLDGGLYDENVNIRYLKKAAKNIDRLLNIVEGLEEISRVESEATNLNISKFDIKNLTEEVFDDLQLSAKKQKIELSFKKGANVSFFVKADIEKIRQVLINLISNSIKYGKKNGYTKVSFYDMVTYILVEISDDGIGIENEHIKHLFDRFYRVDKSRSRDQGGSGLGLAIVKHFIDAHNQTVNVRSTPGLGSTFGFTLDKA